MMTYFSLTRLKSAEAIPLCLSKKSISKSKGISSLILQSSNTALLFIPPAQFKRTRPFVEPSDVMSVDSSGNGALGQSYSVTRPSKPSEQKKKSGKLKLSLKEWLRVFMSIKQMRPTKQMRPIKEIVPRPIKEIVGSPLRALVCKWLCKWNTNIS